MALEMFVDVGVMQPRRCKINLHGRWRSTRRSYTRQQVASCSMQSRQHSPANNSRLHPRPLFAHQFHQVWLVDQALNPIEFYSIGELLQSYGDARRIRY